MALISIKGGTPFDGDYRIDLETFNGRELHRIKVLSGVRGNELPEALQAGDYDLLVAFAEIAGARAGRQIPAEALLELEVGSIALEDEPETSDGGDARPPDSSPMPNGGESSTGDAGDELENMPDSGQATHDSGA